MKLTTILAGGGFAFSLILASAAALAQVPSQGSSVPAVPPIQAPVAPGKPSVASVQKEAKVLERQIEDARAKGKDVKNAQAEAKLGEAAMQAGYKSEAAQHFALAEQDLGGKTEANSSGSGRAQP